MAAMASTIVTARPRDETPFNLILKTPTPPVSHPASPTLKGIESPLPPDRPMDPQLQSPLLRLPPELRNQIYEYVLNPPAAIVDHHRRHRALVGATPGPGIVQAAAAHAHLLAPALLAACRQVYVEAQPYLYVRNVFVAHSRLLTKWPYLLNPARPVRLPPRSPGEGIARWEIEVDVDTEPTWTAEELVEAFEGADELTVRVSRFVGRERSAHGVLGMFLGIRGVHKARLEGPVDDEFARWVAEVMMLERGASSEDCPAFVETAES